MIVRGGGHHERFRGCAEAHVAAPRHARNLTGVTTSNVQVAPKRLEALHEIIPTATTFALLINSSNPSRVRAGRSDAN